jgi:hypothetical protein
MGAAVVLEALGSLFAAGPGGGSRSALERFAEVSARTRLARNLTVGSTPPLALATGDSVLQAGRSVDMLRGEAVQYLSTLMRRWELHAKQAFRVFWISCGAVVPKATKNRAPGRRCNCGWSGTRRAAAVRRGGLGARFRAAREREGGPDLASCQQR